MSNQSYSQADNIGAFSNPEAVEKLVRACCQTNHGEKSCMSCTLANLVALGQCGTGVFASPQDDDLQIELNEQLIYNATRASKLMMLIVFVLLSYCMQL